MSPTTEVGLGEALLNALEAFDQKMLPLGLYACEEHGMTDRPFPRLYKEWVLCLAPALDQFGYKVDRLSKPTSPEVRKGEFRFRLLDGRFGELAIARTSKVKVRKFGSAYRIDAHAKYAERWQELRLDRRISSLWKLASLEQGDRVGLRLFLFIGFAREEPPFEKELVQLDEQLEWDRPEVEYHTRSWPDLEGRAFSVRLSLWISHIPPLKAQES